MIIKRFLVGLLFNQSLRLIFHSFWNNFFYFFICFDVFLCFFQNLFSFLCDFIYSFFSLNLTFSNSIGRYCFPFFFDLFLHWLRCPFIRNKFINVLIMLNVIFQITDFIFLIFNLLFQIILMPLIWGKILCSSGWSHNFNILCLLVNSLLDIFWFPFAWSKTFNRIGYFRFYLFLQFRKLFLRFIFFLLKWHLLLLDSLYNLLLKFKLFL